MAAPTGTRRNPDSEYECLYTGPALTSDEAGEIQIVADLIARDDVAGIAISPSNAPAMAKLLTEKAADIKAKKIAIMTIDADLLPADQGLRTTYFGTHNYGMGVKFCEWLKKLQPNGGKVALMFGNPAAENLNERGYGFRDCIKGEVLTAPTTKSRDPLTGEGGWTEVAPTFTNDDIATANQQFADVLAANPDLDGLRPSRRLGPAGLRGLQRHRQAVRRALQGRQPRRRRRRHGRLPARHGPGRLQPGQCRPASLRDGQPRAGHPDRHHQRQGCRQPDVYRASTNARRKTSTAASAASLAGIRDVPQEAGAQRAHPAG